MDPEEHDKQWASKYLLDPLTEPQPGQETGPGTRFSSTFAKRPPSEASTDRKKPEEINIRRKPTSVRDVNFRKSSSKDPPYPTPPQSASPRRNEFPRPNSSGPSQKSPPTGSNNPYRKEAFAGRQRGSSLGERFPGDKSHRPLDMLAKEERRAHRAPHLKKHHQIGVDVIDNLDNVGGSKYHHEGPFDATYYTRNTSFNSSPLEAVAWSNEEALKATPKERVLDSVRGKKPLDGVAAYPPGATDRLGNKYNYQEGANLQVEDGYKRWPGVKYLDEDIKGKGEPSYTIEKALKQDKQSHRRVVSEGIEMTSRPRSSSGNDRRATETATDSGLRRSSTTGGRLRKRLGLGSNRD